MYSKRQVQPDRTSIEGEQDLDGETIENKVRRIEDNKEPIRDGAPLVYTTRDQGVLPGHNIKTDRFEVAIEAMDAVTRSKLEKREARIVEMKEKKEGKTDVSKEKGGEKGGESGGNEGKSDSGKAGGDGKEATK